MIDYLSIAKQICEKFIIKRTTKSLLNTCWYSEVIKEEFTQETLVQELVNIQKIKNIFFNSVDAEEIWKLIIFMAPYKKNINNFGFELIND